MTGRFFYFIFSVFYCTVGKKVNTRPRIQLALDVQNLRDGFNENDITTGATSTPRSPRRAIRMGDGLDRGRGSPGSGRGPRGGYYPARVVQGCRRERDVCGGSHGEEKRDCIIGPGACLGFDWTKSIAFLYDRNSTLGCSSLS